jgi:hypothetical protein
VRSLREGVSGAIYESLAHPAPDANFAAGRLEHVVIGNRGRLLDTRRTPITITQVTADKGSFELEITAFEDAGARWELPLEDVRRFQFARDAHVAAFGAVDELQAAVARFDRTVAIDCDPAIRDRRLAALLEAFMAERGVAELDHRFAETFVSNPSSGEVIKGHAIVLAELGLVPYRCKIVRDPDLFSEPWSKPRRAEHLISRMAVAQELWSAWGYRKVTLYRGAAVDGALPARSPSSFVSATFSRQVATAHFDGGARTETAVLWRQEVPITRLVMTFLETDAMNRRFHEAESILIADPGNLAF